METWRDKLQAMRYDSILLVEKENKGAVSKMASVMKSEGLGIWKSEQLKNNGGELVCYYFVRLK